MQEIIIDQCDLCNADITDVDLLDGANRGYDHEVYGAMPAQCIPCAEESATPPDWAIPLAARGR